MSYQNLKAEMRRYNVTQGDMADFMGMSTNNVSLKINEKVPFTIEEAWNIRDRFFPTAQIDYLFQSDGNVPTKEQRRLANVEAIESIAKEKGVGSPDVLDAIADMKRDAAEAVRRAGERS